jgi:hypothetical protein
LTGLAARKLKAHIHQNQALRLTAALRTQLSLDQDWQIGIGVLPGRQEIQIRGSSFWGVALDREGAGQAKPGQHRDGRVPHQAEMIDVFLKLAATRLQWWSAR